GGTGGGGPASRLEIDGRRRSGRGAVARPQLAPMDSVVRHEEEPSVDVEELLRARARRRRGAADVGNQGGPARRAIAPPELASRRAIVGAEEEGAAHGGGVGRRARRSGGEVHHQGGAALGAIAPPQLGSAR